MGFDTSPKRIWLGTTIPGKKMLAAFMPESGIERGKTLLALYGGEPYEAFFSAAYALHVMLGQGEGGGPAFRDIIKSRRLLDNPKNLTRLLYGALLTDVRDFLKLRFRATGVSDIKKESTLTIEEILKEDTVAKALASGSNVLAVSIITNYVIANLDKLSREPGGDFKTAVKRLIDILRKMGAWASPAQSASDDRLFNESTP